MILIIKTIPPIKFLLVRLVWETLQATPGKTFKEGPGQFQNGLGFGGFFDTRHKKNITDLDIIHFFSKSIPTPKLRQKVVHMDCCALVLMAFLNLPFIAPKTTIL